MNTCGPHAVDNYNQAWCGGTPVPASHLAVPSDQSEQPVLYQGREDADPERPLYPEVTVKLTGLDGNIGSVMGRVRDALTKAGVKDTSAIMSALWAEVMDADSYPQALQSIMRVVNTE